MHYIIYCTICHTIRLVLLPSLLLNILVLLLLLALLQLWLHYYMIYSTICHAIRLLLGLLLSLLLLLLVLLRLPLVLQLLVLRLLLLLSLLRLLLVFPPIAANTTVLLLFLLLLRLLLLLLLLLGLPSLPPHCDARARAHGHWRRRHDPRNPEGPLSDTQTTRRAAPRGRHQQTQVLETEREEIQRFSCWRRRRARRVRGGRHARRQLEARGCRALRGAPPPENTPTTPQ